MYHNPDSLSEYIKEKNISLYNIKMDINRQLYLFDVNLANLYTNKYLVRNKSTNYITYAELPEIEDFYNKYKKYNIIKKDVKYSIYHVYNEKSEVVLKSLPVYGALKKNSYETFFLSSFQNKKETKNTIFPFYTSIDSIKVNLSYNYPIAIDTIRLKINKPNKYGIQFERYLDYGLIIRYPFKKDYNIVEVIGVDKDGKNLFAVENKKYYTYGSTEKLDIQKYKQLLGKLHVDIHSYKINNNEELLNKIVEYKKILNFNPDSSTFKLTDNNLYQIFGDAEEVVLYISKQVQYVSDDIIVKKNNTHPIFDEVEFQDNNYFYNIKNKKLYKSDKYKYITYLDNNIFEVTKDDDQNTCERIVVDNNLNKKYIGECDHEKFLIMPNGNIMLKERKDFNKYVRLYDKVGNLKYEGVNTLVLCEYNFNSNFLIEQINKDKEIIIFGDFTKTEELESYYIYCENRVILKRGDKYGVYDDSGKVIIPFEYDNIEAIDDKTLLVSLNKKQFIINDLNEVIFEEEKDSLSTIKSIFSNYMFDFASSKIVQFEANGLKGIKDKKGQIIYPAKANEIYKVGPDRFAITDEKGKLGVINNKGKIIIPFIYDKINPYFKDFALLINEDTKKFTFYDYNGKVNAVHKANEFYEIVTETYNNPVLILDDTVIIRYDGKITK